MANKPAPATGVSASRLVTLKRRPQFLRIRKGARWATPAFVLEAKRRGDEAAAGPQQPRFGFTVTKQVGKAVERNRIRRRLKAAVRDVQMTHAKGDFDYVVIARRPALTSAYGALVADMAIALERVHRPPSRPPPAKSSRPQGAQ
jgi:ribonuclease P protein component